MPKDKLLHFGAGLIIGGGVAYFTGKPDMGIAAAALAGGLKEAWDSKHGGKVELLDMVATVLGGVVAAGILYALASMGQISFQ